MAGKKGPMAPSSMHRDLGGGLILRRAREEDAEAVAAFNARVHRSSGDPSWRREPHRGIAAGTRDLMSGDHPRCDASDFTVVEETETGAIVSSACLIWQRFAYEGLEFDAGLPELVGTHPDYRRRGLVREQFEVLHRLSGERGHLMQAIAGIPFYYRQFGYEMAVYMGEGRRIYLQDVPGKADKAQGPTAPTVCVPRRHRMPGSSRICTEREAGATWSHPRVMRSSGATRWPFADCRPGGGAARILLAALFPKRPKEVYSDLWPVC